MVVVAGLRSWWRDYARAPIDWSTLQLAHPLHGTRTCWSGGPADLQYEQSRSSGSIGAPHDLHETVSHRGMARERKQNT